MRNEMCGVWVCSGLSVWKILDKNSWVDVWMPWPPIPTTQTAFLNLYTQHKPLLSGFGTHGHWRYWHNAIILLTVWCPWAGGETNHLLWSAGGSAVGAARPGPHRTFRHSCDWRHRPQTFSPRLHYYLLVMLRNIKLCQTSPASYWSWLMVCVGSPPIIEHTCHDIHLLFLPPRTQSTYYIKLSMNCYTPLTSHHNDHWSH